MDENRRFMDEICHLWIKNAFFMGKKITNRIEVPLNIHDN
jgi:hypothetical protein